MRFTAVAPPTPQAMSGLERPEMKPVVVLGFGSMRMQVPSPWDWPFMARVVKRVCASMAGRRAARAAMVKDFMVWLWWVRACVIGRSAWVSGGIVGEE